MSAVIAVVGCGGIGARHVEALGKLSLPASVLVVDVRADATRTAWGLFAAAKQESKGASEITALESIAALPESIDLAIVATRAQDRLRVLEELLKNRRVKSLILEKFLFSRLSDYARAGALLASLAPAVWVNCSRRAYPGYREIARKLSACRRIDLRVTGRASVAPIGAIAIHFVDLLDFVSGRHQDGISISVADAAHLLTRRRILDFSGVLEAQSPGKEVRLRYEALTDTEAPLTIYLESEKANYVIQEEAQVAYVSTPESSWRFAQIPFAVPFQSNLTHEIARDILSSGTCSLSPYVENAALHLKMMEPLLQVQRRLTSNPQTEEVPFT